MSESTPEQDRIERDLARTRARMDSRLSDLQERLSPGQILDDLMTYFRGSEGGDFARNFMDQVRNNPMPAAVTGIGLAWLMASNPRPSQTRPYERTDASPAARSNDTEFDRHIRNIEEGVSRGTDEPEMAYRDRLDGAKGKALGLVRDAQETAEAFGKRLQDALVGARQRGLGAARNFGDNTTDAARKMGDAIQGGSEQMMRSGQAAQEMAGQLITTIAENPVLLGAISLAAGALLGALVPQSEQEQEALSDLARSAREGASGVAQEVLDRGTTVMREVVDAGRESAAEHGLVDKSAGHFVDEALKGNLAGSVGEVAKEVLDAGESAIRKTGIGQEDAPTRSHAPGSPSPNTEPPRPEKNAIRP